MLNNIYQKIKLFIQSWESVTVINKLNLNDYKICFYFETESDWLHMKGIVNCLELQNLNVVKITSDINDSHLRDKNVFFIGYGSARTYFFKNLKIQSMILTLTDLDLFYLKKSKYKVHYFYVFHSIVSTHRIYNESAFDAYDTIFCVGPYHINEIRTREKIFKLKSKNLIEHGYGKLDYLIEALSKKKDYDENLNKNINVLIAPSWGKESITNYKLFEIIDLLISKNYQITLRLHTMTLWKNPKIRFDILEKYSKYKNFNFDKNLNSINSFLDADIMISEWSGAAIEFSFFKKSPIIFIDTPQKTKNKNWNKLNLPCFEEIIRDKIGYVLKINEIKKLDDLIIKITNNQNKFNKNISNLINMNIFNVGRSNKVAANEIIKFIEK